MMEICKDNKCPAYAKCTASYRGSACAALRATYDIDYDPDKDLQEKTDAPWYLSLFNPEMMKTAFAGQGQDFISPHDFKKKMEEISKSGDYERRHDEADTLMQKVLTQMGYGDGVKIFDDMEKWYA